MKRGDSACSPSFKNLVLESLSKNGTQTGLNLNKTEHGIGFSRGCGGGDMHFHTLSMPYPSPPNSNWMHHLKMMSLTPEEI